MKKSDNTIFFTWGNFPLEGKNAEICNYRPMMFIFETCISWMVPITKMEQNSTLFPYGGKFPLKGKNSKMCSNCPIIFKLSVLLPLIALIPKVTTEIF